MLLAVELSTKDETAAANATRLLDEYFEPLFAAGLLKFRIARHTEHAARLLVLEEWTDLAAHEATVGSAAFAALRGDLAPLLDAEPHAGTYDIVAAGVGSQ
ncbi:MAG: hypothetical protein NVSMB19_02730 [Vulcanimicrobiaceae bacterium]